ACVARVYFITSLVLGDEFAGRLPRIVGCGEDRARRGRLWLGRLLVAVLATVAAIKVSDFAIGWLRHSGERHLLRLPANADFRHRSTEYDYRFVTNALGLRGPLRPFAKPGGTKRIAVLGDSFVAGFGAADDDIFTAKLETLL